MNFQPPIRSGVACKLDGFETTGEMLGKGATAFVYKGTSSSTGDPVAIKEIDYSRIGNLSRKQMELLASEISIMRQLSQFSHPNIVSLRKDFIAWNGNFQYHYLILDFCDGEDFHQYLKTKRNVLMEDEAKYFMTQFGE